MDWSGLMRVGLGALRLTPEAFWAMTPREFAAAASAFDEATAASPTMTRAAFDALRAGYPDRVTGDGDGDR